MGEGLFWSEAELVTMREFRRGPRLAHAIMQRQVIPAASRVLSGTIPLGYYG